MPAQRRSGDRNTTAAPAAPAGNRPAPHRELRSDRTRPPPPRPTTAGAAAGPETGRPVGATAGPRPLHRAAQHSRSTGTRPAIPSMCLQHMPVGQTHRASHRLRTGHAERAQGQTGTAVPQVPPHRGEKASPRTTGRSPRTALHHPGQAARDRPRGTQPPRPDRAPRRQRLPSRATRSTRPTPPKNVTLRNIDAMCARARPPPHAFRGSHTSPTNHRRAPAARVRTKIPPSPLAVLGVLSMRDATPHPEYGCMTHATTNPWPRHNKSVTSFPGRSPTAPHALRVTPSHRAAGREPPHHHHTTRTPRRRKRHLTQRRPRQGKDSSCDTVPCSYSAPY